MWGLVGRGSAKGRDIDSLFVYHPGYRFTRDEIQELQNNLGKEEVRVEFQGILDLSADAEVAFHHRGGSSRGGVHYLYLDDKEIHSVGDDRTKDQTLTLQLERGQHVMRWLLTGGELGEAQLEIAVANADKNPDAKVDIFAPREFVAAARARGVKREIEYGAKK